MNARSISFIVGTIYLLATLYFASMAYSIMQVYQDLNVQIPTLAPYWPALLLIPSVICFILWHLIKKTLKQKKKIHFSIYICLSLLLAPIIYFTIQAIYSILFVSLLRQLK